MANPLEEFEALLSKFHEHAEPENREDVQGQLAELSGILAVADQVLLYLAMHRDLHDDFITFLFEYKQLVKLERHLIDIQYSLPSKDTKLAAPVSPKPWWKFWAE